MKTAEPSLMQKHFSCLCIGIVLTTSFASGARGQTGSLFHDPPTPNRIPFGSAQLLPPNNMLVDPSAPVLPPVVNGWDPNNPLRTASWTAVPPTPGRTLKIHEIVSIRVDDTATSTAQGNAQSRKTTSYDAKLGEWIKIVGLDTIKPQTQANGDPRVQGQQAEVYRGSSNLQTREQMTFNIAAEIADIKPNGTLVLSARKSIKLNDNRWQASLSGICRPQDVGPDNVILSRDIFDLKIDKSEEGHVRDGYSRGFITRWIARFKPF